MDIFELIKKDHEEVASLFDELERSRGRGGKSDTLFEKLKNALELHMIGEEEFFYPVLQSDEKLYASILESREEHHVINLLLNELSTMSKNDLWFAKLSVLKENVENHIEKEERDIFPIAENIIDGNQGMILGLNMEEMKKGQLAAAR